MFSYAKSPKKAAGRALGTLIEIINFYLLKSWGNDLDLLKCFILTVGIVSNHGNWFTSENHNKELKVLAQSYNWLLFLTDEGLSEFADHLLLNPKRRREPAQKAFIKSYGKDKSGNSFTKVKILLSADHVI